MDMGYGLYNLLGGSVSSKPTTRSKRMNMTMDGLVDRAHIAMNQAEKNMSVLISAYNSTMEDAKRLINLIASDRAVLAKPGNINVAVLHYSKEAHDAICDKFGLPVSSSISFENAKSDTVGAFKLGLEEKESTLKKMYEAIKVAIKRIIAWIARYARAAQVWVSGVDKKVDNIKKALENTSGDASAKLTEDQVKSLKKANVYDLYVDGGVYDPVSALGTFSKNIMSAYAKALKVEDNKIDTPAKAESALKTIEKALGSATGDLAKSAGIGKSSSKVSAAATKAKKSGDNYEYYPLFVTGSNIVAIKVNKPSALELKQEHSGYANRIKDVIAGMGHSVVTIDFDHKDDDLVKYKKDGKVNKATLSDILKDLKSQAGKVKTGLANGNAVVKAANARLAVIEKTDDAHFIAAGKAEAKVIRLITTQLVPKAMAAALDFFKAKYTEANVIASALKVKPSNEDGSEEGDVTEVAGDVVEPVESEEIETYEEDVTEVEDVVSDDLSEEGEVVEPEGETLTEDEVPGGEDDDPDTTELKDDDFGGGDDSTDPSGTGNENRYRKLFI